VFISRVGNSRALLGGLEIRKADLPLRRRLQNIAFLMDDWLSLAQYNKCAGMCNSGTDRVRWGSDSMHSRSWWRMLWVQALWVPLGGYWLGCLCGCDGVGAVARLVRQGKTILASLSASLRHEGLVPQGGIHCCPHGTWCRCSILPEAAVIAQPCFGIILHVRFDNQSLVA
jgi:hypothetical protein